MKLEIKELRKAITFFNAIFTAKEKEESYLYLLPSKNRLIIAYHSENDLVLGKAVSFLEEPTCIKPIMLKVIDFTSILSGIKGTKEIELDITSDTVLKVMNGNTVANSFQYSNTSYTLARENFFGDIKYEVSCSELENSLISINNVLKSSYYKDLDYGFNNLVYTRFSNDKIDFYTTNGLSFLHKTIKNNLDTTMEDIFGAIEIEDLTLLLKWLSKTVDKTLNVTINKTAGIVSISTNGQFIYMFYQENELFQQNITIYSKMAEQLKLADKLITVNDEDVTSAIDKKLLKADTVIEFNQALTKSIICGTDEPNNKDSFIFNSAQIKNIIFGADEGFNVSILKQHNNAMFIEFESGGFSIINGIKRNI